MSYQIISTINAQIYDVNNVRTGWLDKEKSLAYKNALRSFMTVDAGATNQQIALIASQLEYLAIYSSAAITVRINGIGNQALDVNGQFVLDGSIITELHITNPDVTNPITLDIVQGDESV